MTIQAWIRGFSLAEVLVSLVLVSGGTLLLLKKQTEISRYLHEVRIVGVSEADG